jgi:outer membrane receptor protein involved in Fe transport
MVGLYYRDQETDTSFVANTTLAPPSLEISFFSQGTIPVDAKETAIFTFNTFYLSPTVQMELGLRWTDYESSRAGLIEYGDLNTLPEFLEPIADLVSSGIAAAFPIVAVSEENETTDEDALTGSLKVRWDWRDDSNLYASYNRGYRRSGISIVPDPDVMFLPNGEDDLLHDEEESDSIELGFKSRLMDGRATLNGAVYYQKFDGYLGFVRGVQVLNDNGVPVDLSGGLIYNGDATLYGLELEGQILLSETWNAGGSFSYAKGEWDDGAEAPCNEREPGEVLGSCDIGGDPISGEPEFSISLNTEYFWALDSSEIYIRGLFKWSDERLNQEASAGIGDVTEKFDAYAILNLYTGWRSSDFTWDVSLFVKNVFDDDTINFQQGPDQYDTAVTGGSYTQVNTVQERTVGLTARYNF